MKAVIPLAGKGTRLRTHTHHTPKPLLKVAGKPVLAFILDDLVELEEPGAWLCRVMYNHFIDGRRRYARQRLVSVSEDQLPEKSLEALPGKLDPVRDVERLDNIMQLQRALDSLSEDHRLVVLLHDCEGYKLSEIQEITGDPVGTIKSRLHRARARLREILAAAGTISGVQACTK